jgi:hypothetical protein
MAKAGKSWFRALYSLVNRFLIQILFLAFNRRKYYLVCGVMVLLEAAYRSIRVSEHLPGNCR